MNAGRVLVVGGGIGGLTTAISLKQCGAAVEVIERAGSFTPVGAGITVQAKAMAIFDALAMTLPPEDVSPIGQFQMISSSGRVLMSGNPNNLATKRYSTIQNQD